MTLAGREDFGTDNGRPTYWGAAAIPNLIGSLLSLIATTTVIVLWIFVGGKKRRDFRYALILNLTVAEFLNCLNNTVSGVVVVSRQKPMNAGGACDFNGWAGQFSVQATDFSVLAISVVTLLTIQLRSYIIYASKVTKTLICLSIWVVPLCTSSIALSKHYYGPVSGNWCWIEREFSRQRYIFTHGWRFAIFIITLCIYVFVFIYMSRRLKPKNISNFSTTDSERLDLDGDDLVSGGNSTSRHSTQDVTAFAGHAQAENTKAKHRRHPSSFSFANRAPTDNINNNNNSTKPGPSQPDIIERADFSSLHGSEDGLELQDMSKPLPRSPAELGDIGGDVAPPTKPRIDRDIWKMLLLNMYPITYLILWIPGMVNRIVEASGRSPQALVILQSSTQFIGLANACVYIYKEHRKDIPVWWQLLREEKRRQSIQSDQTFDIAANKTFIKIRYKSNRDINGNVQGTTPTTYYIP